MKISNKILELETDPRPIGSIKLQGKESYRIRAGDYRILYDINDKTKEVFVYNVLHRKDAFR